MLATSQSAFFTVYLSRQGIELRLGCDDYPDCYALHTCNSYEVAHQFAQMAANHRNLPLKSWVNSWRDCVKLSGWRTARLGLTWLLLGVATGYDTVVSCQLPWAHEPNFVRFCTCGKNADGNTILEFASLGMPVPDNAPEFAAMGIILIGRNGEIPFRHWRLRRYRISDTSRLFAILIANTMDNIIF